MAIQPDDSSFMISITSYELDSKGRLQYSPKTPMTKIAGYSILSHTKWPTLKEFLDPQGAFIAMWYKIFVISCLISVTTDPLFFYIPYINKEDKCISRDESAGTAALVLRSLTDMTFVTHIIHEIRVCSNIMLSEISKRGNKPGWLWRKAELLDFAKVIYQKTSRLSFSIIIDFIAILPIPQVAMFVFFRKMDGTEHKGKILNVFLLIQYVPKIYRIYLSCKELKQTGIWARAAFNFFLYILASHVLGAFWYFLSIQREASCWHKACTDTPNTTECASTYYNCDHREPKNPAYVTFLNKKCPAVSSSNATDFNFGIFLNALESGSTYAPDFSKKFFYSFWWGLRNLSSLGQNLETSTYEWENCFAIVISLIGLLLFLYLIGNVQTYMQMATTKSEVIREQMKIKDLEIQLWMSRNNLPNDMKTVIIEKVRQKLEENEEVHVENLLSILPRKDRRSIKRLLCMDALKKIPMLQHMDEKVLKMICDNLKPVIYTENSYVIRAGEPLDLMLFNTEGIIWTYTTTDGSVKLGSSITKCLSKGDFYGEELLSWASSYMSFSDLPISTKNVKCHTKVEAFSLMAKDLKAVVSKFWWHFSKALPDLNRNAQLEELALSSLRAHRRNRSKNHIKTNSCLRLTIDKGAGNSQELEYQRLYPVVVPRSDAS